MIVVDASVALKWFVVEDGSAEALTLLSGADPLIAPELVIGEMCNAAWRLWRIGRMTREQVGIVAEQSGRVFERVGLDGLAGRASDIALALDHPAYDCFYLALAEQRDATMVTADKRLIARISGTEWQDRVVALADYGVAAP